jgi:hypothetical protein
MSKILVIGAGIFGLDVAIQLSQIGHQVHVFEQNEEILDGTSGASLLRVHSGLHYPRDFFTAKQSKSGEEIFKEKYSSCINNKFKNYYAIAKNDSKTTPTEFEEFANKLNFPFAKLGNDFEHIDYIQMEKISTIYEVSEGVIDIVKLRTKLYNDLRVYGTRLYTKHKVITVNKRNTEWNVQFEVSGTDSELQDTYYEDNFKFVIDATHSTNRSRFSAHQLKHKFEYQITYMIEIALKIPIFGITILDGEFITVMPNGFKQSVLVYGPKQSVLKRVTGDKLDETWFNSEFLETMIAKDSRNKLLALLNEWLLKIESISILGHLTGIRTIESNVTKSDRRRSTLEILDEGFYSITSTKIDHSPKISRDICKLVN